MKKFILAFTAIISIGVAAAFANYTMTQGAGTTFGSVIVGGFHYVQMFVCDLTTPAQCQTVSAAGAAKVDGSAVTQPVSSATLSTAANQTSQITQETATAAALGTTADAACATDNGTCTVAALVKRTNQNVTTLNTTAAAAVPAGSNTIGGVKIVDTAGTNLATVKAASTTPVATDTSVVTALNPNSPGIITLGQTTKSASVPVTIASDQYIDPCQSPNVAKSSVVINITTAATTSLVAVSGATVVYVCGVSMTISEVITTPNTILFEYGTGATCTSPVALTGKYGDGGVTAGIPIVVNASNGGTVFKSAASNGVCALTTIGATASFQGVLTYVQQ